MSAFLAQGPAFPSLFIWGLGQTFLPLLSLLSGEKGEALKTLSLSLIRSLVLSHSPPLPRSLTGFCWSLLFRALPTSVLTHLRLNQLRGRGAGWHEGTQSFLWSRFKPWVIKGLTLPFLACCFNWLLRYLAALLTRSPTQLSSWQVWQRNAVSKTKWLFSS